MPYKSDAQRKAVHAKKNYERGLEFNYKWRNASSGLKAGLIRDAMITNNGIHGNYRNAVTSWKDKPLEKLPVSLRNQIAINLMFGNPHLRKRFQNI